MSTTRAPLDALQSATAAAARVGGAGLAATFATVGRVRGGRPLHPQGATFLASLELDGRSTTGVPWLDGPGSHEARVRVSRGVGLPTFLPDVYGIALRTWAEGQPVDLLFATTGDSAAGRFVFEPRGRADAGPLTTLLPVRSQRGPLVLRLGAPHSHPVAELTLATCLPLSYAHGLGRWHDLGRVRVLHQLDREAELERHDPIANQLPGTEQYPIVERLREPAYAAARTTPVGADQLATGDPTADLLEADVLTQDPLLAVPRAHRVA